MTYGLAFDLIPDSVDGDVSARSSTFPRRQRMSPPRSMGMERQQSQPVLTHVEYAAWNERRAASLSAATGARIASALVPGGGAGRSSRQRGGRARGSVMNLFPSPVPKVSEEMSYPQTAYPMSPMDVSQPQPHIEAAYIQPVNYEQFQHQPPTPPLAHTLSPLPAPTFRPSLSRSSTGTSFYNHDDYNYEFSSALDATIRPQPTGVPVSPMPDVWPAPRQPSVQDIPQTPSPCQMDGYAYPSPVASLQYVQYQQQPSPTVQSSSSYSSPREHSFANPTLHQQYLPDSTPWPAQLAVHQHQLQQQHIYVGEHYP